MLTENERNALNIIRWSSTIAIVCCHYLQAYDHIYAWVLNIGVQVFFFLSGFLYGSKRIKNFGQFYRGRLKKIYLPYCIWVTIAVIIFLLFSPELVTTKGVIRQYLMQGNLPGLNHLWFVPVIFGCYLILPFFDRVVSWKPVITVLIAAVILALLCKFRYTANVLWIALYFGGYLCGRFPQFQRLALIIASCVTFGILYYICFDVNFFREDHVINHFLHASTGILIFMTIFLLFSHIRLKPSVSHLLTGGGSYEIYLTHHIFVLGPLSLLFITESRWFNIIITIPIILLSAMILSRVNNRIISGNGLRRIMSRLKL